MPRLLVATSSLSRSDFQLADAKQAEIELAASYGCRPAGTSFQRPRLECYLATDALRRQRQLGPMALDAQEPRSKQSAVSPSHSDQANLDAMPVARCIAPRSHAFQKPAGLPLTLHRNIRQDSRTVVALGIPAWTTKDYKCETGDLGNEVAIPRHRITVEVTGPGLRSLHII